MATFYVVEFKKDLLEFKSESLVYSQFISFWGIIWWLVILITHADSVDNIYKYNEICPWIELADCHSEMLKVTLVHPCY